MLYICTSIYTISHLLLQILLIQSTSYCNRGGPAQAHPSLRLAINVRQPHQQHRINIRYNSNYHYKECTICNKQLRYVKIHTLIWSTFTVLFFFFASDWRFICSLVLFARAQGGALGGISLGKTMSPSCTSGCELCSIYRLNNYNWPNAIKHRMEHLLS